MGNDMDDKTNKQHDDRAKDSSHESSEGYRMTAASVCVSPTHARPTFE